ncbi:MAG: hypothetical protein M0T80_08435 [Actinomycetota bacterium]|nr:hypothetical protein [Actinomycetota bacterium]
MRGTEVEVLGFDARDGAARAGGTDVRASAIAALEAGGLMGG